jgi:hypothetical protein
MQTQLLNLMPEQSRGRICFQIQIFINGAHRYAAKNEAWDKGNVYETLQKNLLLCTSEVRGDAYVWWQRGALSSIEYTTRAIKQHGHSVRIVCCKSYEI